MQDNLIVRFVSIWKEWKLDMKETCIKVSVIMPVYNAEKYLKMSVGALVNQTLKDIEIICINDNSKDNSLTILRQLQNKDSRIKIINNGVNIGAAETRNKGILAARGEYIVFLDSDDYFYPEMLETAYKEASLQQADLVVWGYQQLRKTFNDNGKEAIECVRKFIPQDNPNITNRVDYLHLVDHVPWNKMVKKELLELKNIRFQNLATNNDVFYSMVVAFEANKIVFINKILVDYYWLQEGSLSVKRVNRKGDIIPAYRKVFDYIINHTDDTGEVDAFANYVLDSLIWMFGDKEKIARNVKDELEQDLQSDSWLLEQLNRVMARHGLWSHNEEFLKRTMAKKCVVEINPYLYYIDGINALCEKAHREGKKVALWGCGKIGQGFLSIVEKPVEVDFVVDSNPDKQGEIYSSHKVVSYESIKEEVDVIVVTVSRYFNEIRNTASNKKVVNWRQVE